MPIKEHKVSLLLSKLLHTHHSYDGLHTYSSPMLSSMEHGHMTHKLRVARSLLIHGSVRVCACVCVIADAHVLCVC